MDIFILRHGDANKDSKKIIDDSKRILSNAGIKEIQSISKFFEELEIKIDHVFSSPLKRAKQTSEIILKNQKNTGLTELAELKPEGSPEDVCKKIIKQKHSTVLIVGHNPLLVDLVTYITNSERQTAIGFALKTGGLAKIKTTSIEPQLKGHLEWLLTPKIIKKVSK